MSDNRPPVYWENTQHARQLVIRASAIGHPCLWELTAAGQGMEMLPVTDVLQRAFDEGNTLEPVVIKRMEDEEQVVFLSKQMEGELRIRKDLVIRYHPDGITNYGSGFWQRHREVATTDDPMLTRTLITEIKALTHSLWSKAVATSVGNTISEYPWQLSSMMWGEGQREHNGTLGLYVPAMWVAYNKGTPPVNDMGDRELCADEGRIHYELVTEPPISLGDLAAKALQVYELVQGEDIEVTGRPCDSPTHFPCRYLYVRPEPEAKVGILEADGDLAGRVDQCAKDYLAAKGIIDEASERLARSKEELLQIAGDKVRKIITDRFIVPVVHSSSPSIDYSAMSAADKKEWNRLKDKYTVKKPTKYLRDVTGRD